MRSSRKRCVWGAVKISRSQFNEPFGTFCKSPPKQTIMGRLLQWSLLALSIVSPALSKPLAVKSSPYSFAPLVLADHHHRTDIDNSYIVLLKDDLPTDVKEDHMNFLLSALADDPFVGDDLAGISHVYNGHITGYSGRFTKRVIEQIKKMAEVKFVEKDQIVYVQEVQRSAPWGLARVSHRQTTSTTSSIYEYDKNGGQGVDVYIIDTGINVNHVEFEGRARWGKTIPKSRGANGVDSDDNGHGTHVAGTIASRKYGVAKKANLIAVKVLGSNGSGTLSDVLDGIVWAVDAAKAASGRANHKGSVANMSLGLRVKSQTLNDAVNKAVDSGLHFAVAAGNNRTDACGTSPAGSEKAVTVGASTINDQCASFSNVGPCVDIFAPGVDILSTYRGSNTATTTLSGTSMASPHIAGLLAYFLSIYPSANFNPTFDKGGRLISIKPQHLPCESSSPSSLYAMAHDALPSFISSYLPSPEFIDSVLQHTRDSMGPIPKKPKALTPAQLKQALLALGSRGMLSGLPGGTRTVNLLAFNNATAF